MARSLCGTDTQPMKGWAGGSGGCFKCDAVISQRHSDNGDWMKAMSRPFIVCSKCGNKRCPKASDHKNECTGSNEVGQKGSVYK